MDEGRVEDGSGVTISPSQWAAFRCNVAPASRRFGSIRSDGMPIVIMRAAKSIARQCTAGVNE